MSVKSGCGENLGGSRPGSVTSLGLSFPSSEIMVQRHTNSSVNQRVVVGPE